MNAWAHLQALVFDLDGTLYDSPELLAAYPRLAVELVAAKLDLPIAEAAQRFGRERQVLQELEGAPPASTRVMVALTGVSLDEWARFVASRIDPTDYLDPADYAWLRPLLLRLHRRYRMGIVSNNNRVLTERILCLLNVLDCFDALLTISESQRLKPDPSLYRDIAALLGVPAGSCLSIGDRRNLDLEPAEAVGMRGVLVRTPQDLKALASELAADEPAAGPRRGE